MYEPDSTSSRCGVCAADFADSVCVRRAALECAHDVCLACMPQESQTEEPLCCPLCETSSSTQRRASTLERIPSVDADTFDFDSSEVPANVTLASKMNFTSLKDMYLKLRWGMERGRLFYAAVLSEEGRKFGKICIVGDMIFIYSFTLSETDVGATIYWFSDLKTIVQDSDVKAFLKVPSEAPNKCVTLLIKVGQTPVLGAVFTRKCTGEEGQAFKGLEYGFKTKKYPQEWVKFWKNRGKEKIFVTYSGRYSFNFLVKRDDSAPSEGQKTNKKRRNFGLVTNYVPSHEIFQSFLPFQIKGRKQYVIDSGIALSI